MTVKVYHFDASPFSRNVSVVVKLLGLNVDSKVINLFKGEQLHEDFVKINPRHQVPFIQDGDLCLSESRAICTYLIGKYGKDDALYPKDLAKRAKVDEMLHYDNGTLVPHQMAVLRPKFAGQTATEDNEKKYADVLKYLDELTKSVKYLAGDSLTLADICITNTLTIPAAFGYSLDSYTNLNKYLDNIKAQVPEIVRLHEIAVPMFKEFLESKKNAPASA